jgi:HEAT repeat protein
VRTVACAVFFSAFLAAQACAGEKSLPAAPQAQGGGPVLVSLECERLSILMGSALEYPSTVEFAARVVPAAKGVAVKFSLDGPALKARIYPPILSSDVAESAEDGYARVFLASGDTAGALFISAASGGVTLTKRLTIDARWQEEPVVAPPVPPPPLNVSPDRLALARERAKGLYDPRVSVRTEAKQLLTSLGPAAVPAITEVLSDANAPWDVRSIASRTLSEIRHESSKVTLAWALRHPLDAVRYSAVAGLKGVTDPEVIALVEQALANPRAGVRSSAIELLATIPGGLRKIRPLLKDADPFVRGRAAWEIAFSGEREERLWLSEPGLGLFDESLFVRQAALRGLAACGGERGGPRPSGNESRESDLLPGVVAALAHQDASVRAAAVAAAGNAWQGRLAGLVLSDPDSRVRTALVSIAAYVLRPTDALPILRDLVNDPEESIRRTARQALAAKADFEDIGLLVGLLDDFETARLAADALQRLTFLDFGYQRAASDEQRAAAVKAWRQWYDGVKGPPLAAKAAVFKQAFEERQSPYRGLAAVALCRERQPLPVHELRPLLLDKHWENRVFGAEALFLAGDKQAAVNALLDALKSERYDERKGAVRAALETADPAAIPVLVAALDDTVREIREQALDALQILAGRRLAFDPSAPAVDRQRAIAAIRDALGVQGDNR